MLIARVTSKGRVTIPEEIRSDLRIGPGDSLLFEITPDRSIQLRVVKNRRVLADLYGALPATRPFPGKENVRQAVGRDLEKVHREEDV